MVIGLRNRGMRLKSMIYIISKMCFCQYISNRILQNNSFKLLKIKSKSLRSTCSFFYLYLKQICSLNFKPTCIFYHFIAISIYYYFFIIHSLLIFRCQYRSRWREIPKTTALLDLHERSRWRIFGNYGIDNTKQLQFINKVQSCYMCLICMCLIYLYVCFCVTNYCRIHADKIAVRLWIPKDTKGLSW